MESNYQENNELPNFPELDKVYNRFKQTGRLKAANQMWMYEAISNTWCIGKSVLDIGCGIGIGTNKLAWNALGVMGVDANPDSVAVARELYEGPKVKFETLNITESEPRPMATFDVVLFIEVIEHIKDYEQALVNLKRFYSPKRKTVFFISSPNRNNELIGKDKPNNEYHVREFTAGEFYEVLTRHFQYVVMYDGSIQDPFAANATVDGNTTVTPLLAKCEMPL
jgi:2-polyprenyl-3-methyl-5-hydroxy-6-metoxy-1,4-benzoquinol methylase